MDFLPDCKREAMTQSVIAAVTACHTNCVTGKVVYSSKAKAKAAVKKMLAKGVPNTGKLSGYKCRQCGLFHVGNRHRHKRTF